MEKSTFEVSAKSAGLDNTKEVPPETLNNESSELLGEKSTVESVLSTIENQSLESLKAENEISNERNSEIIKENKLTEDDKKKIKEETGWSDEIIDAISSMKEYDIYRKAELVEVEINGRKCLVRNDINWEQKDSMGRTNSERAENGLSPLNKEGDVIELHHIGQRNDSPLAELTPDEHRNKENYSVLHDTSKDSEIDRNGFSGERIEHWQARVNKGGNNE